MYIKVTLIALLIGCAIGVLSTKWWYNRKTIRGTFNIEASETKSKLSLNVDTFEGLDNAKYIILRIDDSRNSQGIL